MNSFIDLFIRRPVFASMIILMMVVVGASAYLALGVDRLPRVDLPSVNVRTTLPGASPEETESEIAETLEEVVNTVDGIEELRSVSSNGTSFVIATFRLDRDIDTAAQDVRDKVATAARRLPEEAEAPIVSKFDSDSSPVITFSLSGDLSLRELTEIADKTVKPLLERAKSVGEVRINGGALRTINIDVDADRLAAYRLPITAVRDAIVRQNAEIPGGNLTGGGMEQNLRTLGRMDEPADFSQVVIAQINGSAVRVGDVATVIDGTAERRSLARLNGVPSVSLEVLRQSGANTIEVIEAVKENARRLQGALPPGVKFEIIRDQSRYIYNALHEINTHLILGSILASTVVLIFTRSWRSTVIAALAIPTSVISTFAVMWALGFTLNSVTMLALVLMVGIVIDDAIVVLENIFRFVEEKRLPPMEAARQGTAEIATAVLATTLSLAIIFVPVSFMSSISGRFLYQFGITAAVAVLISLVVSFVLTPTLSARLLGKEVQKAHRDPSKGSRGGFYRYIDGAYTWMLIRTMRFRALAAVAAIGIIAASWPMFRLVPQGFLPQGADEAEFELRVTGPESASFRAMDIVMQQVEADLRAMPEIRTILATVGGGFIGGVNQGECYIRIAPHEERVFTFTRFFKGLLAGDPGAAWRGNYSQTDVMQKIRATMRKYQSRDLTIVVRNFPSFTLGGGNFDIDFSIGGPDLKELARYSRELSERAKQIGGIINVDTTLKLNKPEVRVQIDRERAFDLGVSSQEIGTALRLMVGGDLEISRFRDPQTNENYDVRLRLAEQFRDSKEKIPQLLLSGQEKIVELRNLATLQETFSAARIDRTDRSRDARVRGTIAPGYALADRTEALLAEARAMNMPPAYTVTVRGAGREFARTYREFVFALILSVVFMYMILASQYEHLIHPVTILLSLPVAIPFALLSLYLANEQLNLYSALGILVLFGVVKKNAILQIDHVNQLRLKGMNRYDAIIQGNRDRLRPILMTTLALVAGMLPLWLGSGPGAEERRAVAVCVIGGQTLSLLVTLLLTPVAYSFLDDFGTLIRRWRQPKPAPAEIVAIAPQAK